jgi:proliferating cell nuclear antigen
MFTATIDPQTLDRAIRSVTALVDEAKIELAEGGVRINTVDPPKVGAISLDLLAEAFQEYESDGSHIYLDLKRAQDILSQTGNYGAVEINLDAQDRNLHFRTGGYDFEFSLLTEGSARGGLDPQDLNGPAKIVIDGQKFNRAISIGSMFSEHIRMGVDRERDIFYMIAKGDNDGMHMTLGEDDLEVLEPAKAYGPYSLDYLQEISRAIPNDVDIRLEIGQEVPIKIQYQIADDNGRVTFGLAPRIED